VSSYQRHLGAGGGERWVRRKGGETVRARNEKEGAGERKKEGAGERKKEGGKRGKCYR
jgi:hypothetical protein